ncbi:MAG TPA: hypothetical protein VGS23_04620 [Thermoplasmata archaeon]|nr:hypothetical protein [Thermoplasmata archaeon]
MLGPRERVGPPPGPTAAQPHPAALDPAAGEGPRGTGPDPVQSVQTVAGWCSATKVGAATANSTAIARSVPTVNVRTRGEIPRAM